MSTQRDATDFAMQISRAHAEVVTVGAQFYGPSFPHQALMALALEFFMRTGDKDVVVQLFATVAENVPQMVETLAKKAN